MGHARLLRCASCGVLFTDPEHRQTDATNYYANTYTLTQTVRASTERHRLFRLPEYLTLIRQISAVCPPPGRWLDVGCDHGFFLDEVRRSGYDVIGVEPSTMARAYAHRIGLDVKADITDVHGTVDCVSMWHVLEHLGEPAEMISTIKERLSPGGILAIRVPDHASMWSKLLGHRWIWFQPHIHLVHYTARALRILLERSGFEVVVMRRQHPNTLLTRRSYHFANAVFARTGALRRPSLRDHAARLYQDVTGTELFAIARVR